MSGRFTGELWKGIGDIYSAILVHPFLTGLTDGSLPPGTFAFYVLQDALYLGQYARALAAVASRAPDNAGTEMFARHATPRHAADAVAVERALHGSRPGCLSIAQSTLIEGLDRALMASRHGQTRTCLKPAGSPGGVCRRIFHLYPDILPRMPGSAGCRFTDRVSFRAYSARKDTR